MTTAFISHSDCGRHDTGWGHPEHVGRLRAIPTALREEPELFQALLHVEARHATEDELALAHDLAYIRVVREYVARGGGPLDADTVTSEGSWAAATAAAGAVLDAVDMGFCLFGSVAIGAHYARRRHGAERVLIVDWDVHHGNGTQALVEEARDIRFVSMHQWPWYPGTGAADDRGPHDNVWNVPMRAGLAPRDYVDALCGAVAAATDRWTPDLVMISAGFDSMRGDPLGGFTLEIEDFVGLTRFLVERADSWCSGRVVSSLEGGYAPERLGPAVVAHMKALDAA
jgi:acetoin utilization deacetylase AcuC-like enzyme